MLKNKKGFGDIDTIVYALAFIFAAAIVVFVVHYAYTQMQSPITEALQENINVSTYNVSATTSRVESTIGYFDNLFPFIIIGMIVLTMVSAFYFNSSPVFFFIAIFLLVALVIVSMVFSNLYSAIEGVDQFSDTASTFNITSGFMRYLPLISGIIILASAIVLFGLKRGSTQQL